jgi:hypothetical protein
LYILFDDIRFTHQTLPVASACSGPDCLSLFFAGGVGEIFPDPQLITQPSGANMLIIQGESGVQGDYWDFSSTEAPLTTDHCQTWGEEYGAIMICIKPSSLNEANLIAGTLHALHFSNFRYGGLPFRIICELPMFFEYNMKSIGSGFDFLFLFASLC